MSEEKYCPVGKINCDNFESVSDLLYCTHQGLSTHIASIVGESYEQCPWPSKQKKVDYKDKYEKAANIYLEKSKAPDLSNVNMKDLFMDSCKEAGLKE